MSQLTAANQLTLLRMVLIPPFAILLLYGFRGWALIVFLTAGITDLFDGLIARRTGQKTTLGAWLDPMADKLLLVSVFLVLGFLGELPLWLVVAAVFRDALIVCAVLLSSVMGNPVEMKPLLVSKANTAVQIVLAAAVLAELAFATDFGLLRPALILLSLLLTVASTGAYLVGWTRHMSANGEGEASDR